MPSILIVDDQKNIRTSLSRSLSIEGHQCGGAETVAEARSLFSGSAWDLVMLDVQLPDGNGLDVLTTIKGDRPEVPVIVMSGHGTIDMALEAVRRGAHDFIEKPLSIDRILLTINNALELAGQRQEVKTLRRVVSERERRHVLLGTSPPMEEVRATIALAAPSRGRVLITGESGTGKELIARACHRQSERADRPFIQVNCAAIPSELIESELFGHERGAFTGAHQARKGKFELAHGGTLFLDEIGDMRLDVQAKLLRALQEGEIERVGGSRPIRVDVRVLAATNKQLDEEIGEGRFREDLYYRLNVIPIQAPPLRQRKSDIPELVTAFTSRICADNGLAAKTVDGGAMARLMAHDWPGNVRELHNACERLVILTRADTIDVSQVQRLMGDSRSVAASVYRPGVPMKELVAEAERQIIQGALTQHQGHMTQTALDLGLERSHLYKKMRALGLER